MITLASGVSITLVASSRPPRPTSSSSTSAGWRENSRNAAAVSISNTVIGCAAVGALAFLQRGGQRLVGDQPPAARRAEPEALVEAHQMRRGVDMDALARRLQHRAHEGDGRALAVGAGDVDDRRQLAAPDGRARRGCAACGRATGRCAWDAAPAAARGSGRRRSWRVMRHARMRPPLKPARSRFRARPAAAPAARLRPAARGLAVLVSTRHSSASVARSSWRCTTMSTMPCVQQIFGASGSLRAASRGWSARSRAGRQSRSARRARRCARRPAWRRRR